MAGMALAVCCAIISGQTSSSPAGNKPSLAKAPEKSEQKVGTTGQRIDSGGPGEVVPEAQPSADIEHAAPRITFADVPGRQPEVWSLRERIELGATLLAVVVCYAGGIIIFRILSKLERRMQSNEDAMQAVTDASNSILVGVQALMSADRPWLMIGIELHGAADTRAFRVSLTNRGKRAAEVISVADRAGVFPDQSSLPAEPTYTPQGVTKMNPPKMLLPGEVMVLQTISRKDLDWICRTAESRHKVELAQEHVFLHGRVTYVDVIAGDSKRHETNWCCEYVAGPKTDNLTKAGPLEYNYYT